MRATLLACLLGGLKTGRVLLRLEDIRASSVQLFKIEKAKAWLRAVLLARTAVTGAVGLGVLLGVMLLGLLLMHLGFFILVPCSLRTKALLALGLGSAYLLLGLTGILLSLRARLWVRKSGAEGLLRDAAGLGE